MLSLKKQPSTWIICLFLSPLLCSSISPSLCPSSLFLDIFLAVILAVMGGLRSRRYQLSWVLLWLCAGTLNNPSLLFHSPLHSAVNHPPCHHPISSIRAPPPCPNHQKTTVHISIATACGWKGEWHPPVYNSWDALSLLPHYSSRRKEVFQTMRLNWCIDVPNWL